MAWSTTMTHDQHVAAAPYLVTRRGSVRRQAFVGDVATLLRTWIERWRSRRELLDYMATEHRATRDLSISRAEAETWAMKPFWRE
jgi:uncharacterized protein YjiS (DUF1127 family)